MRQPHLHFLRRNVPGVAADFCPLAAPDLAATGKRQNQQAQCQRGFAVGVVVEFAQECTDFGDGQRGMVFDPLVCTAHDFRGGCGRVEGCPARLNGKVENGAEALLEAACCFRAVVQGIEDGKDVSRRNGINGFVADTRERAYCSRV